MSGSVLLDAGPLVALLDSRDRYHQWAVEHWSELDTPMHTCEAVISEACFLVRELPRGSLVVMQLIQRSRIQVGFHLQEHVAAASQFMAKYADVPMSFADACLVCMAEIQPDATIFTLDSDFRFYRKRNRQTLRVIMPSEL